MTAPEPTPRLGPTDEYGLCRVCGGHGTVMDGERQVVTSRGHKTVPNCVRCDWCDGRDRVTPLIEEQTS